ncbi:pentatricopeptide repeat-containing protein At3g62890-like [Wolffia australiana]
MRAAAKAIASTHASLNLSHPTPDCFVWNTLIRRAAAHGGAAAALVVFRRLRRHAVLPDLYTFPFLLQSFSAPPDLPFLPPLHAHLLRSGLLSHPFAQNSLLHSYAVSGDLHSSRRLFSHFPSPDLPTRNSMMNAYLKTGAVAEAREIFDMAEEKSVVSWTCLIDGLAKAGDAIGALELFLKMRKKTSVTPNEFTVSAVLACCGQIGALELGRWLHGFVISSGMAVDAALGTSLIDMYAKCGCIERSVEVFAAMNEIDRDVRAWSATIGGLALHGRSSDALAMFDRTIGVGLRPNAVTFVGVLSACAHAGFVDLGERIFNRMSSDFGISPSIQHYGCLIDLYARSGMVKKALEIAKSMPIEPDPVIWSAILSGSRLHGAVDVSEIALAKLVAVDPRSSAAFVLFSNLNCRIGKWREARQARAFMEARGIRKAPGCSLVEIGGIIHEFSVGEELH